MSDEAYDDFRVWHCYNTPWTYRYMRTPTFLAQ